MAMSRIQQLLSRLVPRTSADSMEAESRAWMVRCASCGDERSIWDLGGVRWKAKGSKRIWGRCRGCGKLGWHSVYRRDVASTPTKQ